MGLIRGLRPLAAAALTALACATMPAIGHAATTAPIDALPLQAAKIEMGEQIITNLHMFELFVYGGKIGLLSDPNIARLSDADKTLMCDLFADEMAKQRDDMVHALAEANVGPYSSAQLSHILELSKIKYVQDLVLAGGDKSLATPDETSMTPAERLTFQTYGNEAYVGDFLSKFDMDPLKVYATTAAINTMQRFQAAKAGGASGGVLKN